MMQENETIEILYALTDKKGTYSKFVGTSMCSVFENTESKVRVHVFHDGTIKGDNKAKYEFLVEKYGHEIIFYNVRKLMAEVWHEAERILSKAVNDARYSEAALYRLLAPQLLPESVHKLIYLDADTLINMDIRKLWQEKIGENGMAAVTEHELLKHYGKVAVLTNKEIKKMLDYWKTLGVNVTDGMNSGVLLMDLDIIRPMGNLLLSGLRVLSECDTENNFYDQNILNFYFAEHLTHLPWYYNILQPWDREFKKTYETKGIYHYMGRTLRMGEEEKRDTIFYDYFLKTPWADGKFICRFYNKMEEIYLKYMEKRLQHMRKLIANLATKKLVLAASVENQSAVLKLLENPEGAKLSIAKEIKTPIALLNGASVMAKPEKKKEKKKAPSGPINFPVDVLFFSLGPDEKLNLKLPYDVDRHFYLFFVGDYIGVKIMLEHAGLDEEGHFMDGTMFIEEALGTGGVINPTKAFEIM